MIVQDLSLRRWSLHQRYLCLSEISNEKSNRDANWDWVDHGSASIFGVKLVQPSERSNQSSRCRTRYHQSYRDSMQHRCSFVILQMEKRSSTLMSQWSDTLIIDREDGWRGQSRIKSLHLNDLVESTWLQDWVVALSSTSQSTLERPIATHLVSFSQSCVTILTLEISTGDFKPSSWLIMQTIIEVDMS